MHGLVGKLKTIKTMERPCLRLTVPTAKSVVDFHHQVIMRAEHTHKNDLLVFGNTILQRGLCFVECADFLEREV